MNDLLRSQPLNHYRQDPESRLGVPAGVATGVNHWFCGIIALILTTLLYGLLFFLPTNFFSQMLLDRGPTQHAAGFLGFWCVAILMVKRSKLRLQRRALLFPAVPDQHDFVLTSQTADQVVQQLHSVAADPERFVVFNRILIAISNLKNLGRVSDADEILRSIGERDESAHET